MNTISYISIFQMFLMIFSGTALLTTLFVVMMSAMIEE